VVAVNDDVAAVIRRKTDRRKRIIVVPNACDTDLFSPDRDGTPFRREHELEGKILCVHAGAMGPVNSLEVILDAAAALGSRDDLRFVLIGRGSRKSALQRRAQEDGLANVLFLDPIPKSELADVLATADVGLMTVAPIPVLEWNCANKFFDYLASGLPIVLNYQGWQAKWLAKAGCGLSAGQGDLGGFVEAIRRLMDDPKLRAEMSGRARHLAQGDLNRLKVVQPLLASLASGRRSHRR